MLNVLRIYKTYTEAIKGYQKLLKQNPDAEYDITYLTVYMGDKGAIRHSFVTNIEGYRHHGYDKVVYDPEIEDEVLEEFKEIL